MFVILAVIGIVIQLGFSVFLWRTARAGIEVFALNGAKQSDVKTLYFLTNMSLIITIAVSLFLGWLIIQPVVL